MTTRFGIDLDGVCFDFMHAFCEHLEEFAGIACPEDEEITSYYWYETIDGLEKDVFWEQFHKFGKDGGYRYLELLPGAKEGLELIDRLGHEIFYITNRPDYAKWCTEVALAHHQFPQKDNLYFANGSKAPFIRELDIHCFIDDSPRTIADLCANTQARIHCMDYPFNRHLHDLSGYTRVYSWQEFLEAERIRVPV